MKKLLFITTGGTIASADTGNGLAPQMGAQGLLAQFPELAERFHLDVYEAMNIESPDLEPQQWLILVQAIEQNYPHYDGFVITHGTDTLAYTAAALSFLVQCPDKPIVITGSQKPAAYADSDAKANLLDSCTFAAAVPRGGVYVVFHGQAMLGSRAKKVNSTSLDAFTSVNAPLVATIQGDSCTMLTELPPHPQGVQFSHTLDERVLLLKYCPGMRAETMRSFATDYQAIVLECYGVGGIPAAYVSMIADWCASGKLVAVVSQSCFGGTALDIYTVGHRLLQQLDILEGQDMTTEAAVTKLMYLLPLTTDKQARKRIFARCLAGEISVWE